MPLKKLLLATAMLLALATPVHAQAQLPDAQLLNWKVDWESMTMNQCVTAIDAELAKYGRELPHSDMLRACDTLTMGLAYGFTYFWPRRGTEAWARMDECRQQFSRLERRVINERHLMQMCDGSTK